MFNAFRFKEFTNAQCSEVADLDPKKNAGLFQHLRQIGAIQPKVGFRGLYSTPAHGATVWKFTPAFCGYMIRIGCDELKGLVGEEIQ